MPESPINFKLPQELHDWICKSIADMDRSKSEVIRACILHSLESLKNTPPLVKFINSQIPEDNKDPQINFKITDSAMLEWFQATVMEMDCSKSEVLRACIILALPVLQNHCCLIDYIRFKDRMR